MPWKSGDGDKPNGNDTGKGPRPNPWGSAGDKASGSNGGRQSGQGSRGQGSRGQGSRGQGSRGQGSGGFGGGSGQPDFDDVIRKSQDRLKESLPGGQRGIMLILLAMFVLWILSGIYRVDTNEQAVILRFGKYTQTTFPGTHWHMPYPIEKAVIMGVTDNKTVSIGVRTTNSRRGSQTVDAQEESLMLTSDENIVNVKFDVVWKIGDLGLFLFNLREPDTTVKAVAESVMRELVGQTEIASIITTGRDTLEKTALRNIQATLDKYSSGINVLRVQMKQSEAPDEVKDAFLDVQRAEADRERVQNEAEAYKRDVVPRARGEAQRVIQQAEAYRAQTMARADGEASRFTSVYNEYRQAKDVTKKRIYLETMEEILSGMDKMILDNKAGSGVVPYLPLDQLGSKPAPAAKGGNNE